MTVYVLGVVPRPKFDTPHGLFGATCSCGWEGKGLGSERDAQQAGLQHYRAKHDDQQRDDHDPA